MFEKNYNKIYRETLSGESREERGMFWKIITGFLVVLVLGGGLVYVKNYVLNPNKSKGYEAVFLSNGQVYFGKIVKNNNLEIVLTNVFYIKIGDTSAEAQTDLNQPKFSLIKLGNELHGPTDELFINRSQVVFYENLRDDSKVVESIRNYKE